MLNRLIRFYNQNRKGIFKIIAVIAFFIILIQLLNYIVKRQNEINADQSISGISSSKADIITTNTISKASNTSAISGKEVDSSKLNENTKVIETFISYCNSGDVTNAYNMLTDDCKEEIYNSENYFKETYLKNNFSIPRSYSIQNWNNNTYLVEMTEDIMATGKVNNGSNLQDYITIVRENEIEKLNINNYIGMTEINKSITNYNITVTITKRHTYMDYETYDVKVKNASGNTIMLDTKESTKTIYLEDEKGVKYGVYSNELLNTALIIDNNRSSSITIKFTNAYSSSRKMKSMVFSDVILNYNEYKSLQDKNGYEDRKEFIVEL